MSAFFHLRRSLALTAALGVGLSATAGCSPPVREGHFSCAADTECPSGWVCIEQLCFSGAGVDAGGIDAGGIDGALADAPSSDGATPDTATTACSTEADCVDGLYCTMDVCDPVAGTCSNPPRICDADASPCTLAPTCDETMDACVEAFDPTSASSPAHCGTMGGTCEVCAAGHATRVSTCADGACGSECAPGREDRDGDSLNGCECALSDDHDDLAVDSNCDGFDGARGRHIYVTPTGSGTHAGSDPANAATLAEAITILNGTGARFEVLLAAGDYSLSAAAVLTRRAVLFGGYDNTFTSRPGARTLITASSSTAFVVQAVTSFVLDSVDVTTTNRTAASASAVTIAILGTTDAAVRRATITAGTGGAGTAGAAGTDGTRGLTGGSGTTGGGTASGSAGDGGASVGIGAAASGAGGDGGAATSTATVPAAAGDNAAFVSGPAGLGGGAGGLSPPLTCTGLYLTANGSSGRGGALGTPGMAGAPGGAFGTFSGSTYTVAAGEPGMIGGVGGGGGGGGGGASSSCGGVDRGGGGGGSGGGSGGGAGTGGGGGAGGGASIGIFLSDSTLVLSDVTIVTGAGGAGGMGAMGGTGGLGGAGGTRGNGGVGSTYARAGDGGTGGVGGAGGTGGCGGGGGGGPSIGVWGDGVTGSTLTATLAFYTLGSGGAGGASCGMAGSMGLTGETHGF